MRKSNLKLVMGTSQIVDELGRVKAKAAEIAKREKELKDQLVEAGVGSYEGEWYDATVARSFPERLDMDAVRTKLSPQFIAAHTKISEVVTVKVVARVQR